MSTQHKFLDQFAIQSNFEVIGTTLMMKTEGLTAKLTLSTSGTHQHWTGFTLKIVSRKSQEVVDTQTFKFSDHLVKQAGSRDHTKFEVIQHCGWVWYIMTPTIHSIDHMMSTIEKYISMYED